MFRLDAVSDIIQKLLDKASSAAPVVWQAAVHQVYVNARWSLFWGFFWLGFAVIFALVATGVWPLLALERRQYKRLVQVAEAKLELDRKHREEEAAAKGERAYTYGLEPYSGSGQRMIREFAGLPPGETLPFVAWASVVSYCAALVCAIVAAYSFWNAWAMFNNPNWYAIQLLKGS